VYNLLLNAINFSNKGTITIEGQLMNEGFRFCVADEGIGMAAEQVQNLLGKEVTINTSSVDKKTGNGLGYLIIKDLLQLTGCTLTINSQKNTGTRVFVFIPNAPGN
jgi:signal transduction histidine kinase